MELCWHRKNPARGRVGRRFTSRLSDASHSPPRDGPNAAPTLVPPSRG